MILPYGKIDEEFYQQIIAPYEPTVINDQFVVIHIPIRPNELLENIRFVYSLVPSLYVPLDTTSLEVSGILQTQNLRLVRQLPLSHQPPWRRSLPP